jgi:hypothetical protein
MTAYKRIQNLYLHIGMGKTGTSALQDFFTLNRSALQKYGIMYPHQQEAPAQHRLAQSLLTHKHHIWWYPKDLRPYREEWKSVLGSLNSETVLISSELFSGCQLSHIHRIRNLFPESTIKVIVYLRRQDTMFESAYNQAVKATGLKLDHNEFINRRRKRMEYYRIINLWSDVMGRENIIVRPYEMGQFFNHNIFEDFSHHALKLNISKDFKIPQGSINSRFHRAVLEYKLLLNHLRMSQLAIASTVPALQRVSEKFYHEKIPDPCVFSPHERGRILEQYASENMVIAREYMQRKDDSLFYAPLPDLTEDWEPYNKLNKDDALRINKFLGENYPEVVTLINEGILASLSDSDVRCQRAARLLSTGITLKDNCFGIKLLLRTIYNDVPCFLKPILKRAARKFKIVP